MSVGLLIWADHHGRLPRRWLCWCAIGFDMVLTVPYWLTVLYNTFGV